MLILLLFASLSQDLPDGPGKAEVLKICTDCHELDVVVQENRTKDAWKKTVAKMGDRGAEATDQQFEAIIAYLTKYFGRINVNKATADEIVAGVDFTPKEADAIVQYRDKNGPFKAWKDLGQAIDPARVEAKKDHIAVQ
jgi:competence ComEA-like helix-hairpin-helix protein